MPRDANGNMTLPAGNPVVTDTLITSVWANTTMGDLRDEMTDSLSRSGKGSMLTSLGIVDGTKTSPGLNGASEPTSGLYRAGNGDWRFSVLDADVFTWKGTGVEGNVSNTSVTATGTDGSRTLANRHSWIRNPLNDAACDPTGVADSTAAFANTIALGGRIEVTPGTYRIATAGAGIVMPANTELVIHPGAIINCVETGTDKSFLTLGGSGITIKGYGEIRGPQYGQTMAYVANQTAIHYNGATEYSDIEISELHIDGWGAGAADIWRAKNLLYEKLKIKNVGRHGLFARGGSHLEFIKNVVSDIGPGNAGNPPFINAYGMSATSDVAVSLPSCKKVTMRGNDVTGPATWEAYDLHGVEGAIITENYARESYIGVFVGPSTGTNNVDTSNVTVTDNDLETSTQYQRAGIILAPSITPGTTWGRNLKCNDNRLKGYGPNTAAIDAGQSSEEGAIEVVGVQNVDLVGNTLDTPNRFGIHLEKDIRGFTVVANTVSDTVPHGPTGSPRAVCFRVKESDSVWGHAAANTWQRTTGTADAVEIAGTPSTTFGCRYDTSNKAIGGFANVFAGSSIDNMHVESTFPRRTHARGTVQNDGITAIVSNTTYGVASVTRTGTGVVQVTFEQALSTSDYQVAVATRRSTADFAVVSGRNVAFVTISTFDSAGTPTDMDFVVTIFGY